MPEYIGPDERKHWYITDYDGDWQVCSGGPGTGYDSRTWYILNTKTGRTRKIGPVRMRGKNYCDEARAEAERRNKEDAARDLARKLAEESEGRKIWYFTFCQKQSLLKNRFVKIHGTFNEARSIMMDNFGTLWAFQYSEEEWKESNQEERFNLKEVA